MTIENKVCTVSNEEIILSSQDGIPTAIICSYYNNSSCKKLSSTCKYNDWQPLHLPERSIKKEDKGGFYFPGMFYTD